MIIHAVEMGMRPAPYGAGQSINACAASSRPARSGFCLPTLTKGSALQPPKPACLRYVCRMPIETKRLLLRETTLSDVPALYAFLGDANAMRHTLQFKTLRDCRRHVAALAYHRRRSGYAPWT